MSQPSEPRHIVLVVDDSPESLSLLTDALEESGYMALVARSGLDALKLLDNAAPDIVLMDAVMPGADGFETCTRIKQNRALSHIPVIFMTGLSETEHIIRGFQAGGIDYITKPVDPQELLARIRAHIATARLTSSARMALDMSGRSLMAVNDAGDILWSTPGAQTKLTPHKDILSCDIKLQLREQLKNICARRASGVLLQAFNDQLRASYFGEAQPGEFLIGLSDSSAPRDEDALKTRLDLTDREAEVLLWIAQGKSNRDIAEILVCSPRTVNKHLETIYSKLGVENRTSAAMIAVRTLTER